MNNYIGAMKESQSNLVSQFGTGSTRNAINCEIFKVVFILFIGSWQNGNGCDAVSDFC
jgi:hypothetical protein